MRLLLPQAYACVCQEAVWQACRVVQHMLADCQGAVLQRMVAAGCSIAIIGRNQVKAWGWYANALACRRHPMKPRQCISSHKP